MKLMKKWLFPVLTCLIVVGAAVLPQRVSQARDARQFGQVHTEELEAETLPAYEPPSLLERMELYARWSVRAETIPSFQTPAMYEENSQETQDLARQALDRLAQAEVIPSKLLSSDLAITSMDHILLWDPAVSIAHQDPVEFWAIMADFGEGSFWARLDGESGLLLEISLYDPNMARWLTYKDPNTLPELAGRFFGLLELEHTETDAPAAEAPWERMYRVEGSEIIYRLSFNATMLNISLEYNGANQSGGSSGYDG